MQKNIYIVKRSAENFYNAVKDIEIAVENTKIFDKKDTESFISMLIEGINIRSIFVRIKQDAIPKYHLITGNRQIGTLIAFMDDRFKHKGSFFSEKTFSEQQKIKDIVLKFFIITNDIDERKYHLL